MPKDKKGFATKISRNHLRAHLQGLCRGWEVLMPSKFADGLAPRRWWPQTAA